jgi:hypothetical protein
MPTIANPFNFETPADRWSFTDREDLLPRLRGILDGTRQRALVFGRRRMGKTSLIKYSALAAKKPFAFVDLSTAADLSEVGRKLLSTVAVDEKLGVKLMRLLRKYVSRVSLNGGHFSLETDMRLPPNETLEQALLFLDDFAATTDQRITVCFDEFQEIRRLGGERGEWQLRGIIQHHARLNYIFSGSDHRLLHWMTEANAAFFKQLELIEVGAIDPALLSKWIDGRSRQGGLNDSSFGEAVVTRAGPCTGDVVRLAKQVFDFAATKRAGDIVSRAVDAISLEYLAPEFGTIWRSLPQSQRMLLRAIANNHTPFASETLSKYSLTVGAVGTAQTALFDKQILTRVGGDVVFDSPFFRNWVTSIGDPAR